MAEPTPSLQQVPPPASPSSGNPMVTAGAVIVAIVALYVGSGIFVPLVLAVLLSFALAPVVRFLRHLHIPHIFAVLMAVLGAGLVIGLIAFLIATQLARLAGDIPQYQHVVSEKVRALQQSAPDSEMFDRFANAIQGFGTPESTAPASAEEGPAPIPVTIENPPQSPLSYVQAFLGSLLGPLATAAIVTVFVIFLLLEREDFRDRFLKLVSRGDLRTSTKVINEAGQRVSRYLLVQFSVNFCYGIVWGTGLALIGMPNAVLWGLFSALFRYIPFVGTLIAASIPFALAFAIDPGWRMLLSTVGLYVALELTVTNAIEPRLYGSSTGLSALAVIVAAMFWATLWGPIGLILATPLTVCLVVIGRYVPQLKFFDILLGSEPVLVREEQFYQRLLAGNLEEAAELAENHLAENSAQSFYDQVAIPALRLAEADRVRSLTDLANRRTVVDTLGGVVREIEHLSETPRASDDAASRPTPIDVLCIGGQTELDTAAADMIAQVLLRPGIRVKTLPPIAIRQESIGQIDLEGVDAVCLAYLTASPKTYVRFVSRRIRRRAPNIKIIACVFNLSDIEDAENLQAQLQVDAMATSVAQAEAQILAFRADLRPSETEPASESVEAVAVETRLKLRHRVGRSRDMDATTAAIASALDAQIAMITMADEPTAEAALAATTSGAPTAPKPVTPLALVTRVLEKKAMLVIEDVSADPDFAEDPFLLENSLRFYAGVPLRTKTGDTIGVLSVVDHEPRKFGPRERGLLQHKADELMVEIDEQPLPPGSQPPTFTPA